jgi:hypothetical protein
LIGELVRDRRRRLARVERVRIAGDGSTGCGGIDEAVSISVSSDIDPELAPMRARAPVAADSDSRLRATPVASVVLSIAESVPRPVTPRERHRLARHPVFVDVDDLGADRRVLVAAHPSTGRGETYGARRTRRDADGIARSRCIAGIVAPIMMIGSLHV